MSDLRIKVILEAVDRISSTMRRMAGNFTAALQKMSESAKAFGRKIKDMGKSISDIGGWISTRISAPLALAGRQSLETEKRLQALASKMQAALGDQGLAASQMTRLRSESDRLGVSFIDTADSYAGFAASITRAGFDIEDTNKMFNDFAETTVSLKLSNESLGYTFKALEQMASKPTVSMEELKLQLADQIPGAVQIAAKAMGMTSNAFIKAVENGEIMSKDFLPKFSAALRSELGGGFEDAAQGIQAAENRMKNTLIDLSDSLSRSGLEQFFRMLSSAISSLARNFMGLSEPMKKFIVWSAVIAAILGPVIFIIGQMVIGIGGLIIGFGMVAPAIITVVGALKAMSVALVTTPFGWVILGIIAVIAAGTLLVKNWDKVKTFFVGLWDDLKVVFQQGVDWVMGYIQPLLNAIETMKSGLGRVFGRESVSSPLKAGRSSIPLAAGGQQRVDTGGLLRIKVDSEGRASVLDMRPNNHQTKWDVDTGYLMGGAY